MADPVRLRLERLAYNRGATCRRPPRMVAVISDRDPLADPAPLIRRIYAYAAYRLGDGPDAEDATSDTFERALRYRSSFDPRKGTSAAWLIGIARRSVDDILAARTALLVEPPERATHDRDSALRIDLARALERLDRRDRELVALRYGADLTAKQIAAQLELKTNAVEVALHRALGRLRRELAEPEPLDGIALLEAKSSP
jgi:RNA polymerase sigma factor (sigma-70 family)